MHQSKRALMSETPTVEFALSDCTIDCSYNEVTKSINSEKNDFRIMQLNIRGISSKIDELNYLINNTFVNDNPDVILLCETWLTDNSPNPHIPGYNLVLNNRLTKHGGGVAILIADNIQHREVINYNKHETYESCFVEIKTKNREFLVGSIYRPPNTDPNGFSDWLKETISHLKNSNEVIIGLDHNMDLLKTDKHKPTQHFIDTLLDMDLMPTISRPTRLTHTSATLIDNIIVDQKENENFDSYVLIDNTSDHLPCITILNGILTCKKDYVKISKRKSTTESINNLNECLKSIDRNLFKNSTLDFNKKTNHLMNTLQREIDRHLPVQSTIIKYEKLRREPWITNALMKSMNRSRQLYRKQIAGEETRRQQYKHYNDVLKKVKHHAKKQYYIDRCTEYRSNTRQLWKTINKIVKSAHDKSTVVTSLVTNSGTEKITDPKQIANKFGSYFSKVGETFAKRITPADKNIDDYLNMIRRNQQSLYFTPTTPTEIEHLIRKLPNKRSHGHDNIDNILLKHIASSISDVLSIIFNTSLTEGLFPDIFKIAEVVPLHKCNSKENVENYRPISLLVTVSKLLEKIVYSRMYNFLDQTNQLFQSQYRFRTNHGCDHAVSELLSEIMKNLECNRPTTCIYLDLSKAFDTLLHEVILKKMERYGIRGTCLAWLQSYLSNRKMLVKCKEDNGTNVKSDLYDLHYGTPQGSCMGPLLFLVFCNDLQLNLHHLRTIQFADDTTLYFSHRNQNYTQFCITDDLNRIED